MSLGFDESLFWQATPRQLGHYFKAARMRLAREHDGRAWQAWMTARLGLTDPAHFPKLDDLLAASAAKKPKTWQEIKALLAVALPDTKKG